MTRAERPPDNFKVMPEDLSITRLTDFKGRKVEIIAFDISYMGILEEVDFERGTLKIVDGEDFVILEIERVESFSVLD